MVEERNQVKSYSQYEEQRFILEAVGETEEDLAAGRVFGAKRYLDIGAWNAKDKSNTRALFELGWAGVMIEPSPGPMLGLLAEYGFEERIQLISTAVSLEPGLLPLHITHDAVSTSKAEEFERWKNTVKFIGKMSVPTLTLEQISNQFGGFDFINLDAEGISADLFNHAMTLGWEPRCWCVEHDGRTTELLERATGRGYRCTYANGTNIVLVRG